MGRAYSATYDLASTPHAQATSSGTGDVQTLARPQNAIACFITVTTTAARVVFDGSTPGATNGLVLATGVTHHYPIAQDVKFASTAAAASVVDVLWVN